MVKYNPSCIALGNFDGVHIGHDILIRKMVELSREYNQDSIIITFKFVKKDLRKSANNMRCINNVNRKLEFLKSYGVTDVVEIILDDVISKYSPEKFIKDVLVDRFNVKNIVVGYNFTFGYKASGNINTLREFESKYNYKVEEILPVKYNGIVVSSTLVRNLLREGKVQEANKLLKNNYTIYFEDIKIDYNKNKGFVDNSSSIIVPADGRYKVKVGEEEISLLIVTNNNGKTIIFENHIEKEKDIIFIEWI